MRTTDYIEMTVLLKCIMRWSSLCFLTSSLKASTRLILEISFVCVCLCVCVCVCVCVCACMRACVCMKPWKINYGILIGCIVQAYEIVHMHTCTLVYMYNTWVLYALFKNALDSSSRSIMQTLLDELNHLKKAQQPFLFILRTRSPHQIRNTHIN